MKTIKKTLIIALVAILLTACRPMKADAKTVKRYATQTIKLRQKANGKVLKKVKRNTKLRQIKEGKRWSIVRYDGERYVTLKKYLHPESLNTKKGKEYYINYLRTKGPVHWRGRKYTYYTSRLCPIYKLPVPGLHLDKYGMWCDKWDYIVLGSSITNKVNRTIIATPFGKYGRVYDTGGYSTPSWLCDTAVNW